MENKHSDKIKIDKDLSVNQVYSLTSKFDEKYGNELNLRIDKLSNNELLLYRLNYALTEYSSEHIGKDYGEEYHQLCYEEMKKRNEYLEEDLMKIFNKILTKLMVSTDYQLHLLWLKENFFSSWSKFSAYDGDKL